MPQASALSDLSARIDDVRGFGRVLQNGSRFLPGRPWNLARLLEERGANQPGVLGLAFEDRRYTWPEIDRVVNRYAHALRDEGVDKGDAVVLLMDNRPEFVFAMLAINRLEAIAALINTNIAGAGLVHAVTIAKPKKTIVGTEHLDKFREVLGEIGALAEADVLTVCDSGHEAPGDLPALDTLAAAAPEAPARKGDPNNEDCGCYIYTSGTTGLPKAAIVSNIKLLLTGSLFGRGILEIGPNDVTYMTLPLYHSNGMFGGVSASLTTGATLALRRKFSASNFWADVRRFDATCFVYIGELCRYLLNQPESPLDGKHRLRVIAGNGLRPDIWRRFEERFKVPLIREFYGATEGNMPLVNFAGRPGMVGRLLPGQAILRCDAETGELLRNAEGFCTRVETGQSGLLVALINDRIKFDGYLDREASKKKVLENVFKAGDRYFNTGDLITTHPRGWASFADRIGDTFRWKGENVSTNEVAELLNHATGVLEANVYGVQVPDTEGRAGMASLHTSEEFSIDRFALHVLEKLPGFQRPYFLRIQKDMRITGTFKHQKVDYRKEGYDPSKVADPLYFLEGDQYVPLDTPLYETIQSGEKKLR